MTLTKSDLALRPMTFEDLTLVWKWRNHDSIRACAIRSDPISWVNHLHWWHYDVLNERYIFTENERSIGVVMFDLESGYWSFYLDPDLPRGRGYGKAMLRLALETIDKSCLEVKATVHKWNKASLRLHEEFGFTETKTEEGLIYFIRPSIERRNLVG